MTQPRRAAYVPMELDVAPTASPRHRRALTPFLKRAIAPVAVLGLLVGATSLAFTPPEATSTSVADPQHQADLSLGVSRSSERDPIDSMPTGSPVPTMTASPSPSAPAPTASASALPASPTAAPTSAAPAAPSATVSVSASPTVPTAVATLGEKAGTRYTTSPLNIRKGPGVDFDVIASMAEGRALTITDQVFEGWQQVRLDGKAAWVKASYLTDDAPKAPEETTKAATGSGSTKESSTDSGSTSDTSGGTSSGGIDTSPCSKVSGIEGGLTSRTDKVARAVCNAFPKVSSYGGLRPGDDGYHGSGRAIDVMVSGEYGWQVAKWARANAKALGIIEVIYSQQIWTSQRSGDGWRSMSDRGSATANHYDHVHISVG